MQLGAQNEVCYTANDVEAVEILANAEENTDIDVDISKGDLDVYDLHQVNVWFHQVKKLPFPLSVLLSDHIRCIEKRIEQT